MQKTTDALVLAHGAFHGPWCWQPTIARLEAEGVRCVAVDLDRGGIEQDGAALQGVVDTLAASGARVHAIGHSLGCYAVAALAADSLTTATLLAGPIADRPDGPSVIEMTTPGFLKILKPQDDGRSFLSREDARAVFYHRCLPREGDWALERLRPTFVYGGATDRNPGFWQDLPVTYVVCTDDRAVRPDYQQAASALLPFSATIDADHSPMLGAPEALAPIVLEAMGRAD